MISGFDVLAKLKRRNPEDQTVGAADTIIEAKVTRKRQHPYDAKDLKKSAKIGLIEPAVSSGQEIDLACRPCLNANC